MKEFLEELATLMEKHRVEFDVLESTCGYNGYQYDGLEFSQEPTWKDDDMEYKSVGIGYQNITFEDIRRELL